MNELLLLLLVFAGSLGVGYLLISRIPPLLHTPLMSMTNAISAVTLLGAFLIFAEPLGVAETGVGSLAILLAMFNVIGGFTITDRMLRLFRKR